MMPHNAPKTPASPAQVGIFRKYRAHPHNTDTNLAFGFRTKRLDVLRLERALNQIIARHEQLRANFFEKDGMVWQTICPACTITVESFAGDDLRAFVRPFYLERDVLVRAAVQKNLVLLDFCHIVTDGFSMAIFFRELNALYTGTALGYEPPPAADCLVPADVLRANEPYWLGLLQKPFVPLALPADFSADASQHGGRGNSLITRVGAKTTERVKQVCMACNITPFVFYLSAFCLFLARQCGTDDVLTGTNFSCRNSRNLRAIGLYTVIAPVRVSVPAAFFCTGAITCDEATRNAFLLGVNAQIRQSLRHQQCDMDSVLAQKGLRDIRAISRTLFSFEDARMADIRLDGEPCTFVPVPTKDSAFDLNICFFPFKTESRILMIYRSDLFSQKTAARYLDEYKKIITELCKKCI